MSNDLIPGARTGDRTRIAVLATKLHIPELRPSLVERERLLARLAEGAARPLILVSAPAGFGKTTLISDWIARSHARAAWVSLDEDDNDPARFLAYLLAALDTLSPGVTADALDLLALPQPPSWKTVITTLVNSLAPLSGQFFLVLDDYHVITEPAIHAALTFLLEHAPSQMQLVILSRADPPLPLARLRGRGQMLEMRAADLRFTPEETAAFLSRTMKLDLSADSIAALEAETEGWIAGLQLAALCLSSPDVDSSAGRDAASRFIAEFSGSNRFILDYLVEEVLARQPAYIQRFLLRTSILDRLCGELCDAVLEAAPADGDALRPAQAILETLDQLNLFIVPLDHERRWYRYHHLFAEFLRSRLRQQEPELLAGLHCRASEWFERHGYLTEAIGHAQDAPDWERAARLIEAAAQEILMRAQVLTLQGWVESLPDDLLARLPRLRVYFAWTLIITGRLPAAEAQLRGAEQALDEMRASASSSAEEIANLHAQVDGLRALAALYTGNRLGEAVEYARQAMREMQAVDPFLQGIIVFLAGLASYLEGDTATARHAFVESAEIGRATGNALVSQMAVYTSGIQLMYQGQLRRAVETYRRGLRLAEASDGAEPPPLICIAYQALGEVLREWNELDEAERFLRRAGAYGEQLRSPEILVDGVISLARLRQERGDADGAAEALERALEWVASGEVSFWTVRQVTNCQARLWIAQGDLRSAQRWADELGAARSAAPYRIGIISRIVDSTEDLTRVRLLLAQGSHAEAETLLRAILPVIEGPDWVGMRIEALALLALALDGRGDREGGLDELCTSLRMAEPEGYARIYLDEGPAMARLLAALASGPQPQAGSAEAAVGAYAARLNEQFAAQAVPHAPVLPGSTPAAESLHDRQPAAGSPAATLARNQGLIEPLSERELEVLSLLAAGLSTREIAARLVVTEGTVKRHVSNIHGKLDVHSRTQAIARARELHIL